jgi:hypothetical protein
MLWEQEVVSSNARRDARSNKFHRPAQPHPAWTERSEDNLAAPTFIDFQCVMPVLGNQNPKMGADLGTNPGEFPVFQESLERNFNSVSSAQSVVLPHLQKHPE